MALNERLSRDARKTFEIALRKGCKSPSNDFVSQYDFAGAALDDLPWNLHLCGVLGNEYWDYCEFVRKTHPDWSYLEFNFPCPGVRKYAQIDRNSCRLVDGQFCGQIVVSNEVIRVESGDFSDGFRIADIGFSDVNHDGYMDAVLLLVEVGPGSSRVSEVYVLTRKYPAGKFCAVTEW